uniref:Uncharacterized protein n=1 Tax=Cairina moschata TaxID=8855 RepID=A0A8C3CLJ4_CAIMO
MPLGWGGSRRGGRADGALLASSPAAEPGHAHRPHGGAGLRGLPQAEPAAHPAERRRAGGRGQREERGRPGRPSLPPHCRGAGSHLGRGDRHRRRGAAAARGRHPRLQPRRHRPGRRGQGGERRRQGLPPPRGHPDRLAQAAAALVRPAARPGHAALCPPPDAAPAAAPAAAAAADASGRGAGPPAEGPAGRGGSSPAGGAGARAPAPAAEQGPAAAHLAPGQAGAGAGAEAGGEQHHGLPGQPAGDHLPLRCPPRALRPDHPAARGQPPAAAGPRLGLPQRPGQPHRPPGLDAFPRLDPPPPVTKKRTPRALKTPQDMLIAPQPVGSSVVEPPEPPPAHPDPAEEWLGARDLSPPEHPGVLGATGASAPSGDQPPGALPVPDLIHKGSLETSPRSEKSPRGPGLEHELPGSAGHPEPCTPSREAEGPHPDLLSFE